MVTEQQAAWVARVLGFKSAAPSDDALEREDLTSRLKIVNEDMRQWGVMQELAGPLRAAVEAVKAGDPKAGQLLDVLERQIAEAAKRKRVGDAVQTANKAAVSATVGVVAFAKMRLQLQAARSSYEEARANLHAACSGLVKTNDFVNDPRSSDPGTLSAIAAIGDTVPDIEPFSALVDDAIDEMRQTTDPTQRAAAQAGAIKALGDYRRHVEAEPLLTRMQSTAAGTFPIRDVLVGALATLESALQG